MAHTLIEQVTLIDGLGGDPVPDAAVLIKEDTIIAAGPRNSLVLPTGELARRSGNGGTLLPGFIDAHVHITYAMRPLEELLATPFSMRFFEAIGHLRRTLEAGITGARDAGGADAGVRQAVAAGLVPGPRLQISITALSITGGHGDGWNPSGATVSSFLEYPGAPGGICDGVEGVRRKVREVLRAGADVIKVCTTGGVLSAADRPEYSQFSPEELAVIVQEAAYHGGRKVMAHAQGAEGIKNAVRAGIHSIEHGVYLDEEAIELLLRHGTYLVPTLLAPLAVLEAGETGGMPPYGLRKAQEVVEAHQISVGRAHAAGVPIVLGSDAGVMPHGTNLRELGLLVEAGLSPMEAILAGTRTAAACLGWQERLGTIEPGKLADLIVVRGDPLGDIHILEDPQNITLVVQGGRVVKSR